MLPSDPRLNSHCTVVSGKFLTCCTLKGVQCLFFAVLTLVGLILLKSNLIKGETLRPGPPISFRRACCLLFSKIFPATGGTRRCRRCLDGVSRAVQKLEELRDSTHGHHVRYLHHPHGKGTLMTHMAVITGGTVPRRPSSRHA